MTREKGDEVFAGTLNGTGALRVRLERNASDTVIARMVEEASETTEAPTRHFIEKVEQRYSLGMVAGPRGPLPSSSYRSPSAGTARAPCHGR